MELLFAGKYDPSGDSSFYRMVGNSIRQAGDYYKFSCEITKLWDEWVDKIKMLNQMQKNNGKVCECPLIFFIFDDVDLEPQKVAELLSIIIKYLSHPNIIVLTTADEEMFLEVIENNLDKEIGRLPKEWRGYLNNHKRDIFYEEWENEKKENDLIVQTSRMYLGKVLPTSTRYYLRLFSSAEDKCRFRLTDNETLMDIMAGQVDWLLQLTGKDVSLNFLKKEDNIQTFYLNFIGETSRQIGNAYLGWKSLFHSLEEIILEAKSKKCTADICFRKTYTSCKYFLYVAINANHELAEEIEHIDAFVDEIFLMNYNGWTLYVNYLYLNDFLESKFEDANKYSKKTIIKMAFALYSLLMFLENIIMIVEDTIESNEISRKRIHGIASINNFITKKVFGGRRLLQKGLPAERFFEHYSRLFDYLANSTLRNDYYSPHFNKEYLYSLATVPCETEMVTMQALNMMMYGNREWLREIAGILAVVYGNIYLIEKEEIAECQIFEAERFQAVYQKKISDFLFNCIETIVCDIQMLNNAKKRLQSMRGEIENQRENVDWRRAYSEICNDIKENFAEEIWEEEFSRVPLSYILEIVFETYEKKSLLELLDIYPEASRRGNTEKIKEKLAGNENIILVLQSIKHEIEWRMYYLRYICIPNFSMRMKELRRLLIGNQEGIDLLNDILLNVKQIDGNRGIIHEKYYRDLKVILEGVIEQAKYKREDVKEEIIITVEDLLSDIDAVVDLHDENELIEAVGYGVSILVLSKLQSLYLAEVVVDKYENTYKLSSVSVEKIRNGKEEKNAYYYQMYLTMSKIIDNTLPSATGLRMFLLRAANREMRKYLYTLRGEVANEQIPY